MTFFEGFGASDFDAFIDKKWSSNVYNRERLEVKLKLSALGKDLAESLSRKLPGQEMGVTEERPSIFNQHRVQDLTLYFLRDEAQRRQLEGILDSQMSIAEKVQDPAFHHKHINLSVRIHQAGVEAGLYLHQFSWVDWKNAQERCKEFFELGRFGEELAALPESIRYCRGERLDPACPPARSIGAETVLEDFSRAGPWTILGGFFDRSGDSLSPQEWVGRIELMFDSLVAMHAFICWRRENDYHLKDVLKEQKEKVERRFASFQPGDEVRILNGLASGRIGVIDALERKGVVKVRLGAMVISLKVEDLGGVD